MKNSRKSINKGDVLICKNGTLHMVIGDEDRGFYRSMNLETFSISEWQSTTSGVFDALDEFSPVVEIIPSAELELNRVKGE